MTNLIDGASMRKAKLGYGPVSKATGTLAATTVTLFTVAGGEVLITAMWGKVTTAITVANSYKLTVVPTTGDTQDFCVATDIGTTDTAAGSLLTFALASSTASPKLISVGYGETRHDAVVPTGSIKSVSAGTDGNITWYVTWVPLTPGATLVAA